MSIKIESKIKRYEVVKPGESAKVANSGFTDDADRRIVLNKVPKPLADSLRWEHRPYSPQGHAGRTYQAKLYNVETGKPEHTLNILVNHHENGTPATGYPFEVWILGDKAPRGLSALAKSLSMDLRSTDRGWLKTKLDSLAKRKATPYDLQMPDMRWVRAPSIVAAFAMVLRYRCEELGAFNEANLKSTPVLDALLSKKEPKAGPDGTLSWTVDISNPQTGDDFAMFLKEADLDDGRKIPFSVWFSGDYPKEFDGLAVSLSFDLRVNDVSWGVLKLRQLLDITEADNGLWASIPGSEKSRYYPSTIAYIATLILHRLKVLGLADNETIAMDSSAVLLIGEGTENVSGLALATGFDAVSISSTTSTAPAGEACPECKTVGSMIYAGGCPTCSQCSFSRCG